MNEKDFEFAFRRRIQSQALCDRIGRDIDAVTVFRFRKAGTWDADINPDVPADTVAILQEKDHPKRVSLPFGPIVAVHDGDRLAIIEAAEFLLNPNRDLREAAFQYFRSDKIDDRGRISPYVRSLLDELESEVLTTDERTWVEAGLRLHDAIEDDFLLNLAGAEQSAQIQYDDAFRLYMARVFRPGLASFEKLRPPVWDPSKQTTEIEESIKRWVAQSKTLHDVLDGYLGRCGYLPLADEFGAARLVRDWQALHNDTAIWDAIWSWTAKAKTPLATYHACCVFVEYPEWIPSGQSDLVVQKIGTVFDAALPGVGEPLWRLRCSLALHFQYHIEALAPGLDGTTVAASAWWVAEMVAGLVGSDEDRAKKWQEQIMDRELALSRRRRMITHSRMNPSSLRNATLYSPSIWSDALLATAVRKWRELKAAGFDQSFRHELLDQISHAMIFGRMEVRHRNDAFFAFEKEIGPDWLEVPPDPSDDEMEAGVQQFTAAYEEASDENSFEHVLTDFADGPETTAMFCGYLLRARQFSFGLGGLACQNALSSPEWRKRVFHDRADNALDSFLSFLIEWQLQQDEEWNVRVAQILANECEQAQSDSRRKFLFSVTLVSSLAVDVASPAIRLLTGSRRAEFVKEMQDWREMLESVSRQSESWVAGRIRGFLGTISPLL
jgi:hypothetical protein